MSSAAMAVVMEAFGRGIAGNLPTSVSPGTNVLLIDDDPWFRRLVRVWLKKTPYRILESEDGREGMAVLRRFPVDLVITDIIMPNQGGLATILAARAEFPKIKILAVSGVEDRAFFLHSAAMIGADATIEKPVSKQQLLEALESLTR